MLLPVNGKQEPKHDVAAALPASLEQRLGVSLNDKSSIITLLDQISQFMSVSLRHDLKIADSILYL